MVGGEVADAGHATDFQVVSAGLEDIEIFVGELEVEFSGIGRLAVERELEAEAVAQADDGWRIGGEGLVADQPMSQAEAVECLGESVLLDESMAKFARNTSKQVTSCDALGRSELVGSENGNIR